MINTRVWFFSMVLLLQACSSSSVVNVDPAASQSIAPDSVVYVARFEGPPEYVDAATDFFVAELEGRIANSVVAGTARSQEPMDGYNGGSIAPESLLMQDAKANGADILIMGKVAGHSTTGRLYGFSTVHVFDVGSGKQIANFHRSKGNAAALNVHQAIMAAVERTAEDTASVF